MKHVCNFPLPSSPALTVNQRVKQPNTFIIIIIIIITIIIIIIIFGKAQAVQNQLNK
jgi:hypothetical protein